MLSAQRVLSWKRLGGNKVIDKYSPEFSGSLEPGHSIIVPAEMLAAEAAKSHAPPIARKPGVVLGCYAESNRARTVSKSVKVAFHSRWIDEKVSVGITYSKKPIGIGDKATTAYALVDFGTVTPHTF